MSASRRRFLVVAGLAVGVWAVGVRYAFRPRPPSGGTTVVDPKFQIGEHLFPVEFAELSGDISPGRPVAWSLFVRAATVRTTISRPAGDHRAPHASLENYPLAVRTLDALAAARLGVASGGRFRRGGDLLPGGAACTLYVDMHDDLANSVVRFVGRDGRRVAFEWTADYFRGPGVIRGAAQFTGLRVRAENEADAQRAGGTAFDITGWQSQRGEGGLWHLLPPDAEPGAAVDRGRM